MIRPLLLLLIGSAAILAAEPSFAHGGAGNREFPATLLTDDPAVKDEASIPTLIHLREKSGDDGLPESHENDANFEFDKRLTENLGIAVNTGYTRLSEGDGTRIGGWQNLSTTLKYQYVVDGPREFMSSVGITRTWAHTGSSAADDENYSSNEPTIYFGKGLGDLPIGMLRPLAVTGTAGVNIPDPGVQAPHRLDTGLAIEYSIPYLQDQVQDFNLPTWMSRLIPLVEFNYSRPTDRSGPMTGIIAPGFIYTSENWQLGVEALLPATKATTTGTGVLVQFHVFFGELFPATLGKPVF